MKISFIGHASILIETSGIRILSDPWWKGPCFGAQWWNYPPARVEALEDRRVDYIYISHGHNDHFHPGTLNSLNHDAKVIVSRKTGLEPHLRKFGFDVIELGDEDVFMLAPSVTCRVMETHDEDTLMVVADGQEVCVNLNDALHSASYALQSEFISRLRSLYPSIDYVFCGYGVASHFPNCYQVPGSDREATAASRQQHFNHQWARIIADLKPRFGFPFAADVVFFESDLFWVNEPTHNTERPIAAFGRLYPQSEVKVIDIAPGFIISRGKVLQHVTRGPVIAEDLRKVCADEIAQANRYRNISEDEVREVSKLVQMNVQTCATYLKTYPHDYRSLIRFRNSSRGIQIRKERTTLTVDVVQTETTDETVYDVAYTTRLAYLKRSLTIPFADEVLFVGSGGIFEYADRGRIQSNLHREMMVILKKRSTPPPHRYGDSSRLTYTVKRAVKKLLGRDEEDLYDLAAWVVPAGSPPASGALAR